MLPDAEHQINSRAGVRTWPDLNYLRQLPYIISLHSIAMPKGLYFTAVVFSSFFSIPNI